MDRRKDDCVLNALGAVVVAALIVIAGALVIGLTGTHTTDTHLVRVPTPTPTIDATLANRVNEILLAEEQLYFARLDRSPSPTPVPTLTGVTCISDQLGADETGGNAAGPFLFAQITLANISSTSCDLPPIEGIDALDDAGTPIATFELSSRCDRFVCVSRSPLLLDPIDKRPIDAGGMPGTVAISVEYSSGCWSKPSSECHPTWAGSLLMHFQGALDVPAVLHSGVAWSGTNYPTVWGLALVKERR